jgi:signal transduction histidine kinase
MIRSARLRLTAWYLLILAVIVAVLSVALYELLLVVQHDDLAQAHVTTRRSLAHVFAQDAVTLAYMLIAVDLGVLVLAAVGAYFLAGRALRPVEAAMERQRRFSAAASHELRTPLTALRGNLEVALLKRRTPEEYEQILHEAVADTDRMGELIRDLTLLARPAEDHAVLHRTTLDLRDIAAPVVEAVRPLAEARKQTLAIDLNGPLPVRGDPVTLRQALSNLVENAVAYTPAGGAVTVSARRDHGQGVLAVRDTGPGIPPEHAAHLFEPFYQADGARSNADHVGLGLALAAWSVQANGGQLAVDSQPGAGSVFTISLPLSS